jgi:ribokinase
MSDVITVGNALVDIFLTVHNKNLHTRINKGENEACFRLGEKILLDKANFLLGGNACNVGVGLSRAGYSVRLFAEIGDDAFSEMIIKGLLAENVDTESIIRKGESSFAVGINFQDDRTLFIHHIKREHNFPYERLDGRLVFLTSLGDDWHRVYENIVSKKRDGNFILAVNPGTPQITEGRRGVSDILEVSDMLFVNKEEAQAILTTTEDDPDRILSLLCSLGPKMAVMMDGESGSYVRSDDRTYFLASTKCEVVEKTGAGDSWTTGFLASYLAGNDIALSMKWGNANAVSVIGRIGAQAGLLAKDMLEKRSGETPGVEIR